MAATGDRRACWRAAASCRRTIASGRACMPRWRPASAAAAYRDGRLELWLPTAAPRRRGRRRRAWRVCRRGRWVIHRTLAGGDFGARLETVIAEQAALLTMQLKRPVNLVWSRGEETLHDRFRPPARATLRARLSSNGASPPGTQRSRRRRRAMRSPGGCCRGGGAAGARRSLCGGGRDAGLSHSRPMPSRIIPPTSASKPAICARRAWLHRLLHRMLHRRAGACRGTEPLSYRIGMLGGEPRLARCLTTVAALGGWDGGATDRGRASPHMPFAAAASRCWRRCRRRMAGRIRVDRLVAAAIAGGSSTPTSSASRSRAA